MKTSWPNQALHHELSLRNPVADESLTGSERTPEASALLSRLTAIDPGSSVTSEDEGDRPTSNDAVRPRHALKGRLPRLVAVGLVASLLVVVLLFINITSPGKPDAAGAVALERTAEIANEQPPFPRLGPGQFVYTKNITLAEIVPSPRSAGGVPVSPHDIYMLLQPIVVQTWTAADGSGRMSQTESPGPPSFMNQADKAKWLAAGSPNPGAALNNNTTFGPGGPPSTLSGLPTNPSALGPLLAHGQVDIEGLLPHSSAVFPPSRSNLRSASSGVFSVSPTRLRPCDLRSIRSPRAPPGVHLLGTVTDGIGRRGTAVAYTLHGWQDMLIFDPTTSALLEQKTVVVGKTVTEGPNAEQVTPGTVVDLSIYGTPAVVDSSTATPSSSSTGSLPASNR